MEKDEIVALAEGRPEVVPSATLARLRSVLRRATDMVGWRLLLLWFDVLLTLVLLTLVLLLLLLSVLLSLLLSMLLSRFAAAAAVAAAAVAIAVAVLLLVAAELLCTAGVTPPNTT